MDIILNIYIDKDDKFRNEFATLKVSKFIKFHRDLIL